MLNELTAYLPFEISVFVADKSKKKKKKGRSVSGSSTSSASRLSSSEIKNIVERLRHQQYRDLTRKNYYAVWKVFSDFFVHLDYRSKDWEDRLTLFVGYLIQNNKQSSTVKCYVSAIKAVLKEDNIKISEDQYLLSSLIRACRLQNDQIKMRLPIRKGFLGIVLRQTESHFDSWNQPYLRILYCTLFSTMYFGLLQVSEVTTSHPVLARDVHVGSNKKKFLLILRTSKTHWKNAKPQLVKISATNSRTSTSRRQSNLPCPFEMLRSYTRYRGGFSSELEPFFIFSDKSPVSPVQLCHCLHTILKESGFEEKLYSTHSLQIGRTCDLFDLGLSVETIKKLGRWKSNAVFRYLHN